jgi:hypothetical protein
MISFGVGISKLPPSSSIQNNHHIAVLIKFGNDYSFWIKSIGVCIKKELHQLGQ